MFGRIPKPIVCLMAVFVVSGCAATDEPLDDDAAYAGHGEASDFDLAPAVPGKGDAVSPTFDEDHIVSDAFFEDATAMSAGDIQAFLQDTPYGGASWLASHTVGGVPVSRIVSDVSQRHRINPMMILTRFQVEGSHISKSHHPGQRSADRALGCGCFDGQECRSAYLGIDKQINCAAETMRKRYNGSVDRTWAWQKGVSKRALDGIRVTPESHATAAMYAYTPWVLVNRGGNWLVWNITKKFLGHTPEAGTVGPVTPAAPQSVEWVGKPCATDSECGFSHNGSPAFCYDFLDLETNTTKGFCTLVCEGFCPDKNGAATTFCMEADTGGVGICASKSEGLNSFCEAIPGTTPTDVDRWIGQSGAPASVANVCKPNDGF